MAIPGYGSGSSFLFKLFDGLSSAFRLYAVDLLGTGLSGVCFGGGMAAGGSASAPKLLCPDGMSEPTAD